MTQNRLGDSVAQKLKQMFFDHCVRVSYEHKTNSTYSDTMILIAKTNQKRELFRVQKTYKRNSFPPKPNEHSYSVRYTVITCGKVIADVTLKDTDAEYKTNFLEREIYNLLYDRIKFQRETARYLSNAFLRTLDNQKYSKTK